ncbi:MAG TPA: DUF2865 domain-containing protein [Pseudolabrys sp.]|nr:DUF2865 domain-containing protein [Pseudolabrys sp.]
MIGPSIRIATAVAAMAVSVSAVALAQAPNPACQRLEAQLASLDSGNADPARADQIRRSEEAVNRLQADVDRQVAQARKMGCENSGFFSIFNTPPAQCGTLNRQIDQQRTSLENMQIGLERLNGGTSERASQRQSLLIALGNTGCGSQYRSAALAGQQNGFFDRLFGNNNSSVNSSTPGAMGGTFRTICVRTCDGFYYPISYATSSERFRDDEQTCQRMCPASEVSLYTYHNPGEEVAQAVSLNGAPYSALPNAFSYRKALNPACSCRKPGESWADAVKAVGADTTVAPGDVVVTDQNAKRLSQPRTGADGKPIRVDPRAKTPSDNPAPLADAPGEVDPTKRTVRTVGPTFLPVR